MRSKGKFFFGKKRILYCRTFTKSCGLTSKMCSKKGQTIEETLHKCRLIRYFKGTNITHTMVDYISQLIMFDFFLKKGK